MNLDFEILELTGDMECITYWSHVRVQSGIDLSALHNLWVSSNMTDVDRVMYSFVKSQSPLTFLRGTEIQCVNIVLRAWIGWDYDVVPCEQMV
jgi:hypothetical protein